jgi:hypothetical protein
MSLNSLRLTQAIVDSLVIEAVTRIEAGQGWPNDTTVIQAAKNWQAKHKHVREPACTVLANAAGKRLAAKLAKAKADGHFRTLEPRQAKA